MGEVVALLRLLVTDLIVMNAVTYHSNTTQPSSDSTSVA